MRSIKNELNGLLMDTPNRTNGILPAYCFNRSDRLLMDDNGYFCRTREGQIIGPYKTESAVIFHLNSYISSINTRKTLSQNTNL
jgi:hypothetical protein